jgi:hypothetical protein
MSSETLIQNLTMIEYFRLNIEYSGAAPGGSINKKGDQKKEGAQ